MNIREIGTEQREPVTAGPAAIRARVLMTPDYRRDNPYQALLGEALERLGVSVSFPRGYRRVLPLLRMLRQDGSAPDVLHLHWLAYYLKGRGAATKAAYAAKLVLDAALVRCAGVRLVWTVHDLFGHEEKYPRIELWCRRRLARLADAIIVHSARAKALAAETYGASAEKIYVIPHGHFRDVYGPPIPAAEARAKLGLPEQGRIFLFFGMLRPYKGVLKLLAAWAETTELSGRHTLVIAGQALCADYRQAVVNAAARARNVRLFPERVPDGRVSTFLSAADVVVLPYERSLTSGALVLAHSYARPVVTPLSEDGTYEPGDGTTVAGMGPACELSRLLLDAADRPVEDRCKALVGWRSVASQHASVFEHGCLEPHQ